MTGQDVNFRTFQSEVDRLFVSVFLPRFDLVNKSLRAFFSDKEQEQADIDVEATIANTNLQKSDSNLSHLKTQLNQKKMELKSGSSLIILSPSQAKFLQTWNAHSKEDLITTHPWMLPLKRPPPNSATEHRTFLSIY